MDYTIYALKGNQDWCDVFSSLKQGEGRFGWSYVETADLRKLKARIDSSGWGSLSQDEKECYQAFLLDFKAGDYVIYVNVPEWGKCTVARVTGPYEFRNDNDDWNHRFPVDVNSVYVFDRNDASVHPALSSRLKLQGRWWRIYLKDEFNELLEALKNGLTPLPRTPENNLRFLSNEIQPFLVDITQRIQHTHPNTNLECLVAEVFKKVPNVTDVKWQGGAGDHGADILVTFEDGLHINGLSKQSLLVVQVKSYEGEHDNVEAVEDIKRAFEYYGEANMGLIVSTANAASAKFQEAVDKLAEESRKPVALLVGPDVAAFLLRYGARLLA